MSDVILRKTHELMDARNSMAFIAVHDGLTGLHNRTFLTDHFDTLIKGAHRRGERLAVVQLDLDRFKQINDTLGHAAGDYVLVITAQRMRDSCRASDICVRLGGDEFVMILSGRRHRRGHQHGRQAHPGAHQRADQLPGRHDPARRQRRHRRLSGRRRQRQRPGRACRPRALFRQEAGRRRLLVLLRGAAAANWSTASSSSTTCKSPSRSEAFSVYFQPQVSLTNGAITGIEALVRWNHAQRGMISPGEFIPVAEKSGLMAQIGRIIIAKAIAEAAEWHRAGIQFGRLAINVSGTELREPDFDKFLFDTLESAGLPPQKLSLEIVESVILDDEKTGIAAKLRHIRAAGVHLELDDFGTGYASLSHVNPNEIDRLKIDRRFVQNINANGDNTKIVRAITELARGLGISIIAEGAETEAELEFAAVDRLRSGAGLFDRLPDAGRPGARMAGLAQPEEAATAGCWKAAGRKRRQATRPGVADYSGNPALISPSRKSSRSSGRSSKTMRSMNSPIE